MTNKYCEHCGTPLIKEETGKYNTETGEKTYIMVCPVNPCGHTGHKYVTYKQNGFFEKLFFDAYKCERCGYNPPTLRD